MPLRFSLLQLLRRQGSDSFWWLDEGFNLEVDGDIEAVGCNLNITERQAVYRR